MTVVVGLFDLFAYSVPGALYLTVLSYLAVRLGVVEPAALNGVNGVLLVAAAVLLSYLLGYVAYPLGAVIERVVPRLRALDPRAEFLRRVPAAQGRAYVRADTHLLLGGLELHDQQVAMEVSRLRASGLMLRNSASPLALAGLIAVVEAFNGRSPVLMAACAVVFAATSLLLIGQARKLSRWATMKTLELSFWLPGIDDSFRDGSAKP